MRPSVRPSAAAMPPGRPLRPRLQMKVDELFLRWLSDPDTQCALRDGLRRILDATSDPATPDPVTPSPATSDPARTLPLGAPACARPGRSPRRTTGQRAVSDCARRSSVGGRWGHRSGVTPGDQGAPALSWALPMTSGPVRTPRPRDSCPAGAESRDPGRRGTRRPAGSEPGTERGTGYRGRGRHRAGQRGPRGRRP